MSRKIEDLDTSSYWKETFHIFEKAGPIRGLYFENASQLNRTERKRLGFSTIAFLMGVFFYFKKGMFEKGMLILGIGWFHGAILVIVSKIMGGGIHPGSFWLPVAAIAGVFGRYDYYRYMVYEDRMWFHFEKFKKPVNLFGFTFASLGAILGATFL